MKKTGFLAPSLVAVFIFFACFLILMSLRNIVAMKKSYQNHERGTTDIATNNLMSDIKLQINQAVDSDDHVHLFMVGLQLKSLYDSGLLTIHEWDGLIRHLKSMTRE